MRTPPNHRSDDRSTNSDEQNLPPEEQYPGVRPEVARLLVELDLRQVELQASVDRSMADFDRPRGIMGKLFGLRTSVG